MKVWVLMGQHEGEMFSSVHLTEKGAALAAIGDVLDFLGVDDEEAAESVIRSKQFPTASEEITIIEWDHDKLRAMSRVDLWAIFAKWSELTWDNDWGYSLDVNLRTLEA